MYLLINIYIYIAINVNNIYIYVTYKLSDVAQRVRE